MADTSIDIVGPRVMGTKTEQVPFNHNLIDGDIFPGFITKERLEQSFDTDPSDMFIVTYPKSGTTWTQQVVRLITLRGDASKDTRRLTEVIPWFEEISAAEAAKVPKPRIFKSHSPYRLTVGVNNAEPPKYIYVARNPKDTAVSAFHHHRGFKSFDFHGDWDQFFQMFMEGRVESSLWFDHVLAWWEHRYDPNVMFLRFEDMKQELPAVVRQISEFMGIPDLTDAEVDSISEQSGFDRMKSDARSNYSWTNGRRHEDEPPFMRKGDVGDWRNYFTPSQNLAFDELYAERMTDTGLTFDFTLDGIPKVA